MMAPADGIAGSVDPAHQHERGKGDVHAQHHRENIREAAAGEGPEPVRQGPSPGIGQWLYRQPYSNDGEEVLPSAGRLTFRSGSEEQRDENESGDGERTREREGICPQRVDQIEEEHRGAEQVAAAGTEARGEAILDAARGKKQGHEKEKRESSESGSELAAAVALPGGVQRSGKSEHGPKTDHRERAE